jgi:hypothetical protein
MQRAAVRGFFAIQFSFVVSSIDNAVALWRTLGFDIIGTLPQRSSIRAWGPVDVFVMYRPIANLAK